MKQISKYIPLFILIGFIAALLFSLPTFADEWIPKRIKGASGSYIDYSPTLKLVVTSSLSDNDTPAVLAAYRKDKQVFKKTFKDSKTVKFCKAINSKVMTAARKTNDGACMLTRVDLSTKKVKDIMDIRNRPEEPESYCSCNNHEYANINNEEFYLTAINGAEPSFNVFYKGELKRYILPEEYRSEDDDIVYTISNSGLIVWDNFTNEDFYLLDTQSGVFSRVSAKPLIDLEDFYFDYADLFGVSGREIIYSDYPIYAGLNIDTGIARMIPKAEIRAMFGETDDYSIPKDVSNEIISCSTKNKYHADKKIMYGSVILPNGDLFTDKYYFKRKHTNQSNPFCIDAEVSVNEDCAKLFSNEPIDGKVSGPLGDLDPLYFAESEVHECTFRVALTDAQGKPVKNDDLFLEDQFGRKSSIHLDESGSARFRVTIDAYNNCSGPKLTGPYGNTDLVPLKYNYLWAERCV